MSLKSTAATAFLLFFAAAPGIPVHAGESGGQEMVHAEADLVPWKAVSRPGFPEGQEIRPLNRNGQTGGTAGILKFPAGYIEPRHYHTTGGHSAYILKGKMKMAGKVYGPGNFFYFPANLAHGPSEALEEVEALVWTDGPLDLHLGDLSAAEGE